mgnify:CR=1 FL=1
MKKLRMMVVSLVMSVALCICSLKTVCVGVSDAFKVKQDRALVSEV